MRKKGHKIVFLVLHGDGDVADVCKTQKELNKEWGQTIGVSFAKARIEILMTAKPDWKWKKV